VTIALGAAAIAVGSGVAWSGFDVGRKTLVAKIDPVPLVALLGFGQAVVFAAWALASGATTLDAGYAPLGALSVAIAIAGNLLFVRAVQIAPLARTVPFLSFTPVLASLFAALLLGERPTATQLAGTLLVVAGALLVNATRADAAGGVRGLVRGMLRERGGLYMMATAVAWALVSLVDKRAVAHGCVPLHGLVRSLGIGVTLTALLFARGRSGELARVRVHWRAYAATLAVAALALALELAALHRLFVGTQESIKRGVSIAASVVAGRLIFGERVDFPKVIAVMAMLAGVVLALLPG
jgi:drug/metabolite transporter (DMT)-like permease